MLKIWDIEWNFKVKFCFVQNDFFRFFSYSKCKWPLETLHVIKLIESYNHAACHAESYNYVFLSGEINKKKNGLKCSNIGTWCFARIVCIEYCSGSEGMKLSWLCRITDTPYPLVHLPPPPLIVRIMQECYLFKYDRTCRCHEQGVVWRIICSPISAMNSEYLVKCDGGAVGLTENPAAGWPHNLRFKCW